VAQVTMSSFLLLLFAFAMEVPVGGALTTADGDRVDGAHALTFRLCSPTASPALVGDETQIVAFESGSFSASLGAEDGQAARSSRPTPA
jgi:hypothetical protein